MSHQKAPLDVRELITHSQGEVVDALKTLKTLENEVYILSTCNRLSIYAYTDNPSNILNYYKSFGDIEPYLSVFNNEALAIQNLFATASGLESQAIGEHEILGQIKLSYQLAPESSSVGSVMNELVRRALFTGRRVRQETAIGQYSTSLASVALDVLKDVYNETSHLNWLILGTGEMASLFLKLISKKNEGKIYIASKTPSRAEQLARIYGGIPLDGDNITSVMNHVNVVIGATTTDKPVLSKETIANLNLPLWLTFIDLGMPRNFDVTIKNLPEHKLYDLDDIKSLTYRGLQKRQNEIPKALNIIHEEMEDFNKWMKTREITPIISSYFDHLKKIQEEELQWVLPKMGELNENQQKLLEQLVSRMARRLSGKPIEKLKNFSQDIELEQNRISTFKDIFGING